jgi:hypothetical protein
MIKFDTPAFRDLQRTWYRKLKETGFQDLERLVHGEPELSDLSQYPRVNHENREEYYRALSYHVANTEFDSKVDKLILTCHAEGVKAVKICEELALLGPLWRRWNNERNRNSVRYIIRRYEREWGLRAWSQRALNRFPRS